MVCALFNQYYRRINSPLQALCLFLAEYSAYDGSTHAITLQGIVPFKATDGHELSLSPIHRGHLYSPLILDKYCQLFNLDREEGNKNASVMPSASENANAPVVAEPCSTAVDPVSVVAVSVASVPVFERGKYNIMDPNRTRNMITLTQLNDSKVKYIAQAMVEGARSISMKISNLRDLTMSKSTAGSDVPPQVDFAFPFNYWRPDAIGNSIVDPVSGEAVSIM